MQIKIISSSEEILQTEKVNELIVPTVNGTIAILKGHVNLISTLDVGEVKILKTDEEISLVVNGGIIQVKDDNILVLADEANLSSEIIAEEVEKAIKQAEEKMAQATLPPSELIQLEKQLRYEKFKRDQIITN